MEPFASIAESFAEHPPSAGEILIVFLILAAGTYVGLFVWQKLRNYGEQLRAEEQIELRRLEAERIARSIPTHDASS